MRAVFMGTPEIAATVLKSVLASRHEVIAVVTQTDKPKGRGHEMAFPPVKEVALEALERCQRKRVRDWSTIKSAIKNDLSGYLYKHTKRNPMILPVIMEI